MIDPRTKTKEEFMARYVKAQDGELIRMSKEELQMILDDSWQIPDERDQIEVPRRPDLRCREHGGVLDAIRALAGRVEALEAALDKVIANSP